MKKLLIILSIIIAVSSYSSAENWISNYGYYENSNEVSAKNRIISKTSKIFDFENSPNSGGEKIQKGRYYIDTKYKGGYNGTDTDHVYLDEIAGKDGKDGLNGSKGEQGNKGEQGIKGRAGADGVDGEDGVNGNDGRDASNAANEDRFHHLEETKYILQGTIRVFDSRKFRVDTYGQFDVRHTRGHEIGVNLTYKLGKSYEEKRIEELEEMIQKLKSITFVIPEVE